MLRIGLVGAEHPVDQLFAVAAAAGGHQDVRLAGQLALAGWTAPTAAIARR